MFQVLSCVTVAECDWKVIQGVQSYVCVNNSWSDPPSPLASLHTCPWHLIHLYSTVHNSLTIQTNAPILRSVEPLFNSINSSTKSGLLENVCTKCSWKVQDIVIIHFSKLKKCLVESRETCFGFSRMTLNFVRSQGQDSRLIFVDNYFETKTRLVWWSLNTSIFWWR